MRKGHRARALAACAILGLLAPATAAQLAQAPASKAHRSPAPARPHDAVVDGHRGIVVMLDTQGDISALLANHAGATLLGSIPSKKVHLLAPPPLATRDEILDFLASVSTDPNAVVAELNRRVVPPEGGCDLPLEFGVQQCTIGVVDGDPTAGEYYGQPAVASIQAEAAQLLSLGTPAVVGVVDTGVDLAHPLFEGRIAPLGFDFVDDVRGGADVPNGMDDDGDGEVDEGYGHGTHVAGTIALVNPDALVLPIRALDSEGNGTSFDVARGIFHAVDVGADVVNLSVSMASESVLVGAALAYAEANEVRVFSSAGNTGSDLVLFPANYDPLHVVSLNLPFLPKGAPITGLPVYAVAAVDAQDVLAEFSAYGDDVDFCAPGVDVYSAVPGGGYAWWSGTSMACAVASGAASLLRSTWNGVSPSHFEPGQILVITADPIVSLNPGFDALLGAGRVNAYEAAAVLADG